MGGVAVTGMVMLTTDTRGCNMVIGGGHYHRRQGEGAAGQLAHGASVAVGGGADASHHALRYGHDRAYVGTLPVVEREPKKVFIHQRCQDKETAGGDGVFRTKEIMQ